MVYSRLHRTNYSYLTLGCEEEGVLDVGVRREEVDDHIGYLYRVYIHRRA